VSARAAIADGADPARVVEGLNSVDVTGIAAEVAERRSSVSSADAGHRFVAIGQLIPRKNAVALLKAFASVRGAEDVLSFVGQGPLRADLEALSESLGLGSTVEFNGQLERPEVITRLAISHTLVLASTNEVWGLVVNEALAAGLHAVVSNRAGVASQVDGMRGVWVTDPTPEALGEAMSASRATWTGHVAAPAILAYTPEASAERVLEAVTIALGVAPSGNSANLMP